MTAGRRRRVVGVIIDGDVLRGVEMRRSTRGRVAAVAAAEVAIPEGVLEGSLIVDHDGIAAALRLLWVEGGFKTSNLAYGISGRDATMRLMTVPAGVDDEITGLARYELADRLPYPMDEAVTDVQEIARRPEAVEVLAGGVRTSVVESIATVARAARLSIDTVGLIPISLASAIPAVASDGTEALVSIDGSRTTVVLRTGRSPRIVRVLASGGGYLHDQLADELASAIAEVDHFRRGDTDEVTADGQQRRFPEAVDAVMAAIRFAQGVHAGTGELNRVLLP
ncbi:MAG: type IV pilus biogenesis protein PilM, partial [Acidimicrobiales bacterium]